MIYGVDVSSFQGAYPWNSGESFGFAKATEGTFYQDKEFAHNWNTMWEKKILRGAYHFGHPGTSAVEQANYFVDFVKPLGLLENDCLALDLEVSDGVGPAAISAWAVLFVQTVEKLTGKNVWIYTDGAFIANGSCAGLYKSPLWIANPSGKAGAVTVEIKPWPVWTVQQYAFGTSPSPDKDVLNGDDAVWEALVNLVPAVSYKTVTASYTAEGADSLTELCTTGFGGTAISGVMASTVLRLTLDNSPDNVFADNVAAYVSAGDLATKPVPAGTILYYPKKVKVN